MRDVFLGTRVLAVEVAAIRQQFRDRHFPSAFVFLPLRARTRLVPPFDALSEFLELDGGGLGVVFPTFGQRLLVIPDLACRAGAVEEQDVRRDAGVRRKDAVGQADDGVEVEFLEQFFLDAGAAEQTFLLLHPAVRHGFDLLGKMTERFDEKTAGAGGRVEDGFPQARVGDGDHEPDHRPRSVKLARIARSIAHLAEHGFVERAQRVQFIAGGEVDAVELVDDIAQQVATDHAVSARRETRWR